MRGSFLFVQAMINIPIFSMLYWIIVYFGVIAYSIRANNLSLLSFMIAYSIYMLLDKSPTKGGWTIISPSLQRWFRNYPGFSWLAQYFDSQLVKTQDLDPKQQYIFCYHPHGIIGIGSNTMLATNGADFEQQFPGVSNRDYNIVLPPL